MSIPIFTLYSDIDPSLIPSFLLPLRLLLNHLLFSLPFLPFILPFLLLHIQRLLLNHLQTIHALQQIIIFLFVGWTSFLFSFIPTFVFDLLIFIYEFSCLISIFQKQLMLPMDLHINKKILDLFSLSNLFLSSSIFY